MRIAISAETTIDLTKELIEKFDIHIVPFTLVLGDVQALDGEIKPQELFDYALKNKELPKTSAVNEAQYDEHFSNILKSYDAIIHFSLSGKMSSAYNNAVASSKNFNNVYVIDTKSLSTGIALLAIYASDLINEGLNIEEIVHKCMERREKVSASFVLDTLKFLYLGGRCSALSLFGANLLKLRPKILVANGKMQAKQKYMGKGEKVVEKYCDETLSEYSNIDKKYAFVTNSSATPEMVNIAKQKLKDAGFENIFETIAGCTISCHCGPKCLGILFMEK